MEESDGRMCELLEWSSSEVALLLAGTTARQQAAESGAFHVGRRVSCGTRAHCHPQLDISPMPCMPSTLFSSILICHQMRRTLAASPGSYPCPRACTFWRESARQAVSGRHIYGLGRIRWISIPPTKTKREVSHQSYPHHILTISPPPFLHRTLPHHLDADR
jgi:hypothetical protein